MLYSELTQDSHHEPFSITCSEAYVVVHLFKVKWGNLQC